jgi:hypothetical protein
MSPFSQRPNPRGFGAYYTSFSAKSKAFSRKKIKYQTAKCKIKETLQAGRAIFTINQKSRNFCREIIWLKNGWIRGIMEMENGK